MVIFCRHGKTVYNEQDKFQGFSDSPLTSEGINLAYKIRHFLEKNVIDTKKLKCFSSPLQRAKCTTDLIFKNLDIKDKPEITTTKLLTEICYGSWEGISRSAIEPKFLERREENRYMFIHPGVFNGQKGESYKSIFLRTKKFLQKVLLLAKDYHVLVVTHHGVLINVFKYFGHLNDKEINKIRIKNNQLLILNRNKFDIYEL
ncbi:MAG: phosphoglycerate mutase family protein [Candidatus Dojkabacteria bacterium]|nr:phosphoglycerate mutase family protein [Candidatus Dojkabacteria bacterium]